MHALGARIICGLFALALAGASARAQRTNAATFPIDLPGALRLAGARNLDVQIARERLVEAQANRDSATARFFPWLAPGFTYRRHDDKIQDVEGNIIGVNKYSYAPGAALNAQVNLGEAIYENLASRQLADAARHAAEAQRQESVLAAAHGFFELLLAEANVGIAREAVGISTNYERQIGHAVEAGVAFRGDALRISVQSERNQMAARQAIEQRRVASARLAQTLRLDPLVELTPDAAALSPLRLIETNAALDSLIQQTLAARPELKQSQALVGAARNAKTDAAYGPLIPSLGAQAFFGGLGGGRRGVSDEFGAQEDYFVGLSWRLGPGGLFDRPRLRASEARLRVASLNAEKLRDEMTREVIEAFAHWQSLGDQLETAGRALAAAESGLRLAQQRKEFAVGVVLETIVAEQDLTRARMDYVKAVAEFNKAQYTLTRALGKL